MTSPEKPLEGLGAGLTCQDSYKRPHQHVGRYSKSVFIGFDETSRVFMRPLLVNS
jgi:hypothetical protein